MESCELTVLMPCLNEIETLATCIRKAKAFMSAENISGEIVIADNGSTDGSQAAARALGARVVAVSERGYGAALIAGIEAAQGKYIIMADSDDSYDFTNLMPFLGALREGNDLVMGNRFKGGIAPGAMPPLHKYLGNPVLTFIGQLLFNSSIGDFHCGLRGFPRDSARVLNLQSTGMEFASEMVVKATLLNQRIIEVPTTLSKDGRSRPPHLRSWRDGWRHLRFLLMFSPRWLYFYPGIFFILIGLVGMIALVPEPLVIGRVKLGLTTLLLATTFVIIGTQVLLFGILVKQFAVNHNLLPKSRWLEMLFRVTSLEGLLVLGILLVALGGAGVLSAVLMWQETGFGPLAIEGVIRLVAPSLGAIVVGVQVIFTAFFSSILNLSLHQGSR
jgi:glycosyltransferase involved in cell wall biosynthesis